MLQHLFRVFTTSLILLSATVANQEDVALPIGDQVHCDVYTFIGEFLARQSSLKTDQQVKEFAALQLKHKSDPDHKPLRAEIIEGELAGLLTLFLKKNPRLVNITLYTQDGIGIASSSLEIPDIKERDEILAVGVLPDSLRRNHKLTYGDYIEKILPLYQSQDKLSFTLTQDKGTTLIGYASYLWKK